MLGLSGRITQQFQNNALTPLLALFALLLGFFAILVTPKEEEPQIDVTFANVFIALPGASAKEVEQLISIPAQQVLSEIKGVDDIYSVSQAGMSILTVAFEVGLARDQAILNLYNQIYSHADWLPSYLGAGQPLVKPMGIDDVPIMSLTLFSEDPSISQQQLTSVANQLEVELKTIPGTRDIYSQGRHEPVLSIQLDPQQMNAHGLTLTDVRNTLLAANQTRQHSSLLQQGEVVRIQAGSFLSEPQQIGQLIVGLDPRGAPIYLADVANIHHGAEVPEVQVFHYQQGLHSSQPAVTLAIAKQAGFNAFDITQAVQHTLTQLDNTLIPHNVQVKVTRNYGDTAKEKSDQLMAKLLFATFAVVLLVLATMGWREAVIVGGAIFITLALTLFASWAWGFTLNRISLFALIFSIGILVDDAIVVMENIHRHMMQGGKSLLEIIPKAVDEVGGPTILATFTVIAALMPMAFVSGLMGPYMSPIPINASTGMLISLAVAFVVTPWLAFKLLKHGTHGESLHHEATDAHSAKLQNLYQKLLLPLLSGEKAKANRNKMLALVIGLILMAVLLPVMKAVVLKMLPFDNKSEFQIMVDMPESSPMEDTLAVLEALGGYLKTQDTVTDFQMYAGTHAPINFNGLVRQYYLRQQANSGDIQVNLVHKSKRSESSHNIARAMREPLQAIGKPFNANIKIVEVPPGPPVMAPLVAEVYGNHYEQQILLAKQLQTVFNNTDDIVDVDSSVESEQEHWQLHIDRQKAALLKLPYDNIVKTIHTLIDGEDVSVLHSVNQRQSKYATPMRLTVDKQQRHNWQNLMQFKLRSTDGHLIALSQVITVEKTVIEPSIYHKNLRPVVFINADMAGDLDSPLYGLFDISAQLPQLKQYFTQAPAPHSGASIKWDGEWQITFETFRDMGIAYGVGMILIYLLVVAQFKSYLVPLIIMAPIPLTIIGVMPGHALLGAQFTATSMIGMIALAGIIVRNSILLVDFINQQLAQGSELLSAAMDSAIVRTKPILLTALAAMTGAFFILDDPIFNGLAISLIFGILISTLFTLILVPMLYFVYLQRRAEK